MKTCPECTACFFKQASSFMKQAGGSEKDEEILHGKVREMLIDVLPTISPPEFVRLIYKMVGEVLGTDEDFYSEIKKTSNEIALKIYDQLKESVSTSKDTLLTAAELAIVGNIIDYGGAKIFSDLEKEMEKILTSRETLISEESKSRFDFEAFRNAVLHAKNILYLADNAGEVVFDKILMEGIANLNKEVKITYVVKENPIINDALKSDAIQCDIEDIADVMSSGSDAPGTYLGLCSPDFLKMFREADVVISKGQGNFEALEDADRTIFFLLKAKCPVIAKEINAKIGDVILLHHDPLAPRETKTKHL